MLCPKNLDSIYTIGVNHQVLAYNEGYSFCFNNVVDRNRTTLRCSKLKSCNSLMVEQTNPWEQLHPQDESIQHRGGKHLHRYELEGDITLLSLS